MIKIFIDREEDLPKTYDSYIEEPMPVEKGLDRIRQSFPWYDVQVVIVCKSTRKIFVPAEFAGVAHA
jgi:hypothetical protein